MWEFLKLKNSHRLLSEEIKGTYIDKIYIVNLPDEIANIALMSSNQHERLSTKDTVEYYFVLPYIEKSWIIKTIKINANLISLCNGYSDKIINDTYRSLSGLLQYINDYTAGYNIYYTNTLVSELYNYMEHIEKYIGTTELEKELQNKIITETIKLIQILNKNGEDKKDISDILEDYEGSYFRVSGILADNKEKFLENILKSERF